MTMTAAAHPAAIPIMASVERRSSGGAAVGTTVTMSVRNIANNITIMGMVFNYEPCHNQTACFGVCTRLSETLCNAVARIQFL